MKKQNNITLIVVVIVVIIAATLAYMSMNGGPLSNLIPGFSDEVMNDTEDLEPGTTTDEIYDEEKSYRIEDALFHDSEE